MRSTGTMRLSAFAACLTICATALGAGDSFRVLDRAKVYHGFAESFTAPAAVDSARVLETLPAMKKIKDDKVEKDSARWLLLMNEANQHFQRALKTVAREGGYDLIAEAGAVTGPRAISNVTDAAIAAAARG